MNITLLPGHSRITLESLYNADTGPIVLPERLRSQRVYVGRVTDSNLTGRDKAHIGVDSLMGCRVLLHHRYGKRLSDEEMIVPNLVPIDEKKRKFVTPFLAIVSDDFKFTLSPTKSSDRRCGFCGPASSEKSQNNVMLAPHPKYGHYCPRCNRTEAGDVIKPSDVV